MDMTEQKNDFGVGSVEQNIIRMAVPMTVAQILNLLYNLVDRMYIGHIPGASSLALTGVGITFPIISMITAFANLFGMGSSKTFEIKILFLFPQLSTFSGRESLVLRLYKDYFFVFGRLAPYLERRCVRFATPAVSRVPRTM